MPYVRQTHTGNKDHSTLHMSSCVSDELHRLHKVDFDKDSRKQTV